MSTETRGFDAVYQIDEASLLAALDKLLVHNVELALRTVSLAVPLTGLEAANEPAVPANTLQHGTLQVTSQPDATLTMPGQVDGNLTLVVTFPTTLLSLDAVPAVLGVNVFAGVGALAPANAGKLVVTFVLSKHDAPATSRVTIRFERESLTVAPLSQLPNLGGLSPTGGLDVADYGTAVQGAVASAVTAALGPLLPLAVDIPFDAPDICDVGVRQLATRLLPGGRATQASLAFFVALRQGTSGNLSQATFSTLPTDVEGSFALANGFLLDLVCCLIQRHPTIAGLGGPTEQTTECCRWEDVDDVSFNGETVKLEEMEICIERAGGSARFTVFAHASKSGTGWSSHGTIDFALTIQRSGNGISATPVDVVPDSWVEKEWWVWLIEIVVVAIGAGIGYLVGGPGGAVAGGAIALAIVAVGDLIISTMMGLASGTISGALSTLDATGARLLPDALTDNFGGLSEILEVEFDDLAVAGKVRRPSAHVLHEDWDVVLHRGDRIDLDRGVVVPAGAPSPAGDLEADLVWLEEPLVSQVAFERELGSPGPAPARPGALRPTVLARRIPHLPDLPTFWSRRVLAPSGGARLVKLAASYWSLTERSAREAAYPGAGQRVPDDAIPLSDTPYPPGTVVAGVRTTAGRYAKCAAWRDSNGALHLSFVTYDTPVPLRLRSSWTITEGGAVPAPRPTAIRHEVSRTGRFDAEIPPLPWLPPWLGGVNVPLEWFWEGKPIKGAGTLRDGTTKYHVAGRQCRLTTAMGAPLRGALQARLTLSFGTFVATAELDLDGTVTTYPYEVEEPPVVKARLPEPPFVDLPSLAEQLPAAIAKGMGVPLEKVRLR